jgi:ribosome biogenesis GTPase A
VAANYDDLKQSALEALREVANLAQRSGAQSMARVLREDRIPRLADDRFHLVVLGEFNHGKTTLVNALLGEGLLPTGVTPTTALIHSIEYGDVPKAVAHAADGTGAALSLSSLSDYEVGGRALQDRVERIELHHPSPFLAEGLVLIDTPGVNDINEARAEITYGYIPRSDAVLFLLDAGQILKESERAFVSGKLLSASRDKVIFVVNKMDLLTEEEQDEALTYARTHLERLIEGPKVFGISAHRYLEGDREGSGIPELLAELTRFLQEERGRVLLDNAIDAGIRTIRTLRTGVEIQRQALSMEATDLRRRLKALEADLEHSQTRMAERRQRIGEEVAAVKALVRSEVESFGRRFAQALPAEIEASDAKDLQQYLGGFIESRFRDFAEEQAGEIERRLQEVAERALSFVADDARAQASKLGAALGPGMADVDLAVDTRAYDVGVFAVGALGVTLMVFSNVVVGGAMALAAPALAYFAKGRTERQIKERALEDGPKVILDASAKMADALEERIDDFAQRLLEFVAKINDEMTRSIAELVQKAAATAEQGEGARDMLESEAGMTLVKLADLEGGLEGVRRGLWSNGSGKVASA